MGDENQVVGVDRDRRTGATYELLVHYGPGVDPVAAALALLGDWSGSARPKLLRFSRSGPGAPPSEELLRKALTFRAHEQDVALALRTSRGATHVDKVDFYFTNPAWKFSSAPPNFVAVTFTASEVDAGTPGYARDDLARLLRALVIAGPTESGLVESYQALHSARVTDATWQLRRLRGLNMVHWITFWPATARSALQRGGDAPPLGVEVLEELPGGGAILGSSERPPGNTEAHVDRLVALAERLLGKTR